MNRTLSRSSAAAGTGAAVLARLFYGLMLDAPYAQGGAWLAALLGLALSIPALWLIHRNLQRNRFVTPILALLLLLDAASTMECAGYTASFLAFTHVPNFVLMLPLALAALRCAYLGGDAIGAAARLWMRVLAALMAVVILLQFPYFHPAWVFPLLGEGQFRVFISSIRVAGWITTLAGAGLLLCDEGPCLERVLASVAIATAAAMGLIVLRLMMTPPGDYLSLSKAARVDSLLTNGRAPLYLQLPMIVIWFMAMLHLLCFEVFACAALSAKRTRRSANIIAVALAFFLAVTRAFEFPTLKMISDWRWPALMLLSLFGREAHAHA